MKSIAFAFVMIILGSAGIAQNVAINADGTTAHPSAILDISSESKGILIPRISTSDRENIVDPANGLLVYDTSTKSFWFFSLDTWLEIPSSSNMSGPAAGDLSGTYPSPNVVRIQNLDVAPGVPFDKHVLKWDMLNNTWKGMKDSLSLPMNASFSNNGALFGITNTNSSSGSSALKGKMTAAGSGITPSVSMGVWGDNSNGLGVVGTSSNGVGTYGLSFNNHGVYGYSVLEGFAGISGSHASDNGIGVLGSMSADGMGIYGLMTGPGGVAGVFETSNSDHTDYTLDVKTSGTGILSNFYINNVSNTNPAIFAWTNGLGSALKVVTTNVSNASSALDVDTDGGTTGLRVNTALGRAAIFAQNSPQATNEVIDVFNYGKGKGLYIQNLNATSSQATGYFTHTGLGQSLIAYNSNPSSTQAAVKIISEGNRGLEVSAQGKIGLLSYADDDEAVAVHGFTALSANAGVGVKGESGHNGTNGIGVYGRSGNSDPTGIGVKGVNYTSGEGVGAVTGVNLGAGVGVYGESTGANGIGILGAGGTGNVQSKAAVFKNTYASNTKSVVDITSNGLGANLFIHSTHLTNAAPLLHFKNAGNGQFLRLENNIGDVKTSISKEGNIATDGTITVREGKGIIRNTGASQLRYESHTSPVLSSPDEDDYEHIETFVIQFDQAFSQPPMVMVAGLNSFYGTNDLFLTPVIHEVTTTQCKLSIINLTAQNTGTIEASWNLVVIGVE